jgi:NTP pyrophosphatase (non-canonical NTP hydrolase)
MTNFLQALRVANQARQHEWTSGQDVDLVWRANELAGEVGEACNVAKKLARERRGWPGSRATLDQLAAEIADVIICADLLAMTEGIDLEAAVIAKFNATSEKVGLAVRLDHTSAKSRNSPGPADVKSSQPQAPQGKTPIDGAVL